ncbi:homeodomain-containing protein [Phyllobacterium myrsinacearum]|nr:homeodomain-containing protein [Phyllobacterium myrsinacearum]
MYGLVRHTYSQITLDERRKIERWRAAKISVDIIAEKLGRHRSTISSELKRNTFDDPEMRELTGYYGLVADTKSKDRRYNLRKLMRRPLLREAIIERIRHGWSPEQIAGRLKREEARHGMSVCHETIYRFAYSKDGQAIKLWHYLPERVRMLCQASSKGRMICPRLGLSARRLRTLPSNIRPAPFGTMYPNVFIRPRI